jgi:hypothetical protein
MGHKPYRILGVVTVLGILGAIIALIVKRRTIHWDIIFLFSFAILGVWGFTFVRGTVFILQRPYFPFARSAYPAIIPTLFFLAFGWWWILDKLGDRVGIPDWGKYVTYMFLFISLDFWSIMSVIRYYS